MLTVTTPAQIWMEQHGLLPTVLQLAGSTAVIYAALHDVAARTVPNKVPAALLGCGLTLRLLTHSLLPGLAWAFGIFVLAFICFWRGWLGGGDVKLLPAGALLIPPALCPVFLGAVALSGGLLALIYLTLAAMARRFPTRPTVNQPPTTPAYRRKPPLWRRALAAERWRLTRGIPLPYATAIAAGFLFTLFRT